MPINYDPQSDETHSARRTAHRQHRVHLPNDLAQSVDDLLDLGVFALQNLQLLIVVLLQVLERIAGCHLDLVHLSTLDRYQVLRLHVFDRHVQLQELLVDPV